MLVREYLTFIEDVRRLSPHTVRLRATYVGKLAAEVDVLTATTSQLRAWIALDRDWLPATVNAVTASVRSFYRWAHESGHIAVDVSLPLHTVKVPSQRRPIATAAQIAAGMASERLEVRAVTLLGAECGLRVHEIAKLSTSDREDDWLTIAGKGGQVRTVHMSPELCSLLDELEARHGAGYYFPSRRGGHTTTETIRKWSRRELGTNPHSLRHRAGTAVYRGTGNNLRVAQVFLGHSNPATTAIYVHVEREDLLAASAAARIAA